MSYEYVFFERNMKITIAGHFVEKGKVGGAEHMLYNLVIGMISCGADINILCNSRTQFDEKFVSLISKNVNFTELNSSKHRFLTEQISCAKFGKRIKSDAILFPNYYTPFWIPKRLGRVCTVIHDFQYRHLPQYFSNKKKLALYLAHYYTCKKADKIILLSEHAKKDIKQFYGNSISKKIVVIPNPVSWDRFKVGDANISKELHGVQYLLCVAAQYPHKNVSTIIHAFKSILQVSPDLKLVLAGQISNELVGVSDDKQVDLKQIINELGVEEKVKITGYLDDSSLGWLYKNARIFLFPSVFEGFGMPPVEALGFSVPTITTQCASIPEVTKGMAVYVDNPMDSVEWTNKMKYVLENVNEFKITGESSLLIRNSYEPSMIAGEYLSVMSN